MLIDELAEWEIMFRSPQLCWRDIEPGAPGETKYPSAELVSLPFSISVSVGVLYGSSLLWVRLSRRRRPRVGGVVRITDCSFLTEC
jgi:hypothetical protein